VLLQELLSNLRLRKQTSSVKSDIEHHARPVVAWATAHGCKGLIDQQQGKS